MLQYVLIDAPDESPGSFFDLSLVLRDGTLLPAYHALAGWVRRYSGDLTLPRGPIELPPAPR
jgi:hypothetical protein